MNRLVGAVQDGEEEKYANDLVGNRLKKESTQGKAEAGVQRWQSKLEMVYGLHIPISEESGCAV